MHSFLWLAKLDIDCNLIVATYKMAVLTLVKLGIGFNNIVMKSKPILINFMPDFITIHCNHIVTLVSGSILLEE